MLLRRAVYTARCGCLRHDTLLSLQDMLMLPFDKAILRRHAMMLRADMLAFRRMIRCRH